MAKIAFLFPFFLIDFCVLNASAVTVQPGESIQPAINNLPAGGGTIELAAGTHVVGVIITT